MRWLLPVAATLAAGLALAALLPGRQASADWQEIAWPFGRDGWAAGRAFRCGSSACGGMQDVYIRPKIGLCNCTRGVTGDAEVDAVSDIDLLTDDFMPRGDGQPVAMAGLSGIARAYRLHLPGGRQGNAAGIALSHRCDLVVAASVGEAAGQQAALGAIALLLARPDVSRWLAQQFGKG
jgi:hypothetical protein